MVADQFPGQGGSEELDHIFYVNELKPDMHSETIIYDLTPLRSALFSCDVNNPSLPGDHSDEVLAELRDVDGNVTNRVTCEVTAGLSIVEDADGMVTSASAYATCADAAYTKVATKPVIDCVSQRVLQTEYATLRFTDFIRMYPDLISGSGVNVPACIGRVMVIS